MINGGGSKVDQNLLYKQEKPGFDKAMFKFGDLLYSEKINEVGYDRVTIRKIYGYADTGEVTRVVTDIFERSFVRYR